MGSPKPLLRFDGRTALEIVLSAAAEAGVEKSVVVAGKNGREVMDGHALWRRSPRVRWAFNDEEGSEQLRSLQIGLAALGGEALEGFFLHPVDHPLVTAADYRLLLEALAASRGGAGVFILSHARRRGHPILCRGALAEKLQALLPAQTAREVIEREEISYVLTPNAGVLEDMDTPEDYQRLLGLYRRLKGGPKESP
jgi:molybdenum cofactor cytidylyltransferase